MRALACSCVFMTLLVGVAPRPARAASIEQDRITVDATDPLSVSVEHRLSWASQSAVTKELVFYLARGVDVAGVQVDGKALKVKSKAVRDSYLVRWSAKLGKAIPGGGTGEITLSTTVRSADVPGIRVDASGGVLAPGSGWFPALRPESDELLPHRTVFKLPSTQTGVACGQGSGGIWGADVAVRPFAAWGEWTRTEFRQGETDCVAYRAAGASGELPGTSDLGTVLVALETALGPPVGNGPWTFVDVGGGMLTGGYRTVLWDESAANRPLHERDLAGALAVSFWTESMEFIGPLAGMFSRSFPLYLGDAAAATLDESDRRWQTHARLIGARRDEFIARLKDDQPLKGLIPSAPNADLTLRTRGVVLTHMTEAASRGATHFLGFLRQMREAYAGGTVDDSVYDEEYKLRFGVRNRLLLRYLESGDLPDFAIRDHGPQETKSGVLRYRVEVENTGSVGGAAQVVTFDVNGVELYRSELLVQPAKTRAVMFGDPERIARIELNPGGRTLQPSVRNELVELTPAGFTEPRRPAFKFERRGHDLRWVTGLDLELDGVSIRGFEGHVMWWATHHGPTGLLMLGDAAVTVAPGAPHTAAFAEAMGRQQMEFNTPALWIRFPLSFWKRIGPQLEAAPKGENQPLDKDVRFMFEFSFRTYFAQDNRAEVPPPGGTLAIFSLGGVERRGFVRDPKADGTVHARFWDQLRGRTLWEDTR